MARRVGLWKHVQKPRGLFVLCLCVEDILGSGGSATAPASCCFTAPVLHFSDLPVVVISDVVTLPSIFTAVLCQLWSWGNERVHRMPQSQLLLHFLPAQGISLFVSCGFSCLERVVWPWGEPDGSAGYLTGVSTARGTGGRTCRVIQTGRAQALHGSAAPAPPAHPAHWISEQDCSDGQVCRSGSGSNG